MASAPRQKRNCESGCGVSLPLYHHWYAAYRFNRYLRRKPPSHAAARLRYQMEAILTLTENGQIGPEPVEGLGLWLWERIAHTLHEFELENVLQKGS
jgi:hypothetical protein